MRQNSTLNHHSIIGLTIALCLTLGFPGPSQAESVGPRVKTPHETFDFGTVPQNALVTHVFWLHSTGDEELVLGSPIPNCGCTQAPLERTNLPPGDSTRVELTFSTGLFHGPVTKFTQIVSNSTGRAPALIFKANVVADSDAVGPLVITPDALRLDNERLEIADGGYQYTISLQNSGSNALDISLADRPDRDLRFESFGKLTLQPGQSHKLTLHFNKDMPKQTFSRSISFDVTGAKATRVTLPVFKTAAWEDTPGEDS